MAKAMEVELKLLIAPADTIRLRRFTLPDGWTRGAPKHKNLLSIYFDTDDLFLQQHSIALRVRRDGMRWIQTVKVGGDVKSGLRSRIEIEAQVAHDHPDFTKIDEPSLTERFLSPELQRSLRPLFTTEFHRTIWLLESPAGDVVEMALDIGEVRIDQGKSVPICEVELELKIGNPAALYEAALVLLDRVPLHLENTSKAERGYALFVAPPPPRPVKAAELDLSGDDRISHAFQSIAWNCISHLQCNRPGLLTGEDVEYVHQMRIALRRLRSAMGLFSKIVPAINDVGLISEVRWLGGELGAARDWDVFITETLPPILSHAEDDPALLALNDRALAITVANRGKAKDAAASQRYQRFLLNLGTWLSRETWRVGASKRRLAVLDQPILKWSSRLLDRRHNQLMKLGENLGELSGAEQHKLRIAGKKLRYAAEFLSYLHPGRETRQYLKALAGLQDILGKLNDHVVTRRLLDELRGRNRSDALHARAIGEITGWEICRASAQLESLGRVWRDFTKQKRFWKK